MKLCLDKGDTIEYNKDQLCDNPILSCLAYYNAKDELIWTKYLYDYVIDDIVKTEENKFLIGGHYISWDTEDHEQGGIYFATPHSTILSKMNLNGDTIWTEELDNEYDDSVIGISKSKGNNYWFIYKSGCKEDKIMDRTYDTVSVAINGNKIEFNQPPKIVNDRTLLPLRKIFETLGASVTWNEEDNSITAKKGNTNIKLFIDNKIAYVNNKEVELDTPPTVINDNTMVPVRFISESLGCKVDWDEFLMQVDITTSDNSNL